MQEDEVIRYKAMLSHSAELKLARTARIQDCHITRGYVILTLLDNRMSSK